MVFEYILEKVFFEFRYKDDQLLDAVRQTQRHSQFLRGIRLKKPVHQNRYLLQGMAHVWCRSAEFGRLALPAIKTDPEVLYRLAYFIAQQEAIDAGKDLTKEPLEIERLRRDPKLKGKCQQCVMETIRYAKREVARAGILYVVNSFADKPGTPEERRLRAATILLIGVPNFFHKDLPDDFGNLVLTECLKSPLQAEFLALGLDALVKAGFYCDLIEGNRALPTSSASLASLETAEKTTPESEEGTQATHAAKGANAHEGVHSKEMHSGNGVVAPAERVNKTPAAHSKAPVELPFATVPQEKPELATHADLTGTTSRLGRVVPEKTATSMASSSRNTMAEAVHSIYAEAQPKTVSTQDLPQKTVQHASPKDVDFDAISAAETLLSGVLSEEKAQKGVAEDKGESTSRAVAEEQTRTNNLKKAAVRYVAEVVVQAGNAIENGPQERPAERQESSGQSEAGAASGAPVATQTSQTPQPAQTGLSTTDASSVTSTLSALSMMDAAHQTTGVAPFSVQEIQVGNSRRLMFTDTQSAGYITKEPAADVVRWLGYVRRSGTCRNFFPVARWEPGYRTQSGTFKPFTRREAIAYFPSLGGINLSGCRSNLSDGSLVVMDLYQSDYEPNLKPTGGVREDFGRAVDWQRLSVEGRIRPASDFGIWYVMYPVESDILSSKPVINVRLLPNGSTEVGKCPGIAGVPVLLAVGGRYVGPMPLHESAAKKCYVTLENALEEGLGRGFTGSGTLRRMSLTERTKDDWKEREITWIDASRMTPVKIDLVTDDTLLRTLAAAAPERGGSASASDWVSSSAALQKLLTDCSPVRDARVRRLIELLERQHFGEGLYADVGRILMAALPQAALGSGPLFEAVVERFKCDTTLREALESEKGLAERVRQDETRAREVRAELEQLERRLAERRSSGMREIEAERTKLFTEKARLEAEVKAHSKGLEELIESTGLVGLRERLNQDIVALEHRNATLQHEAESIDAQLREAVQNASRYAFDGAVSAKLLDAAAAWRAGVEADRAAHKANEAARATLSPLKGVTLRRKLIEALQSVRAYRPNDILNLFVTISQNFLTIFAGPPGSGKTSICFILSRLLGLADAGRFLSVSVERGWTSKRDFIGYWNPLTKTFESADPARRDAFRQLDVEARSNIAREPFWMLLDEANLSPMEYYWADFMNAADERSDLTEISLGDGGRCRLPATLRFLATINGDHTTESLSPRLIDRAAFVTLPEPDMPVGLLGQERTLEALDTAPISWEALQELFASTATPLKDRAGIDAVLAILSEGGMRVSMRRRLALERYMSAAAAVFDNDVALGQPPAVAAADFAIAQFLLPGISGMGEGCRKTLEKLCETCRAQKFLRSTMHLERMLRNGEAAMDCYAFLG